MAAVVWMALLALGACFSGYQANTESRGEAMTGFGPIAFGMSLEQAFAAIQGNGRPEMLHGEAVLYFIFYVAEFSFDTWVNFGSENRAKSAVLISKEAPKQSGSLAECSAFFHRFHSRMNERFGQSDYRPRQKQVGDAIELNTRYTYADRSSIHLKGVFNLPTVANGNQPRCDVKILFQPQWNMCEGTVWCDTIRVYPRPVYR